MSPGYSKRCTTADLFLAKNYQIFLQSHSCCHEVESRWMKMPNNGPRHMDYLAVCIKEPQFHDRVIDYIVWYLFSEKVMNFLVNMVACVWQGFIQCLRECSNVTNTNTHTHTSVGRRIRCLVVSPQVQH